jgi:hypothetical protein
VNGVMRQRIPDPYMNKPATLLRRCGPTLINYDSFNQVEYLIVKARDTVERFSIRLQEINKNMTELEWTILCTVMDNSIYSVFGNWTQKNTR